MHAFLQSLIGHQTALFIGNFTITWYGISFAATFLFGWWWISKQLGSEDFIDQLVFILILSGLIGARLGFAIASFADGHSLTATELFHLRDGGMSWHGGLLSAILTGVIFCRMKNMPISRVADATTVPLLVGIVLGRLANFVNGELPGKITSSALGFMFPSFSSPRHPEQLYEALWGIMVLVFVLWLHHHRFKRSGDIFLLALMLVSIGRFMIEFVRDSRQIGYLSLAQYVSLLIICLTIGVYYKYRPTEQ